MLAYLMDRLTALTWSWLNVLNKKRMDALLSVYGDLTEALGHMGEPLLKSLGCRDDTVLIVLNRLEEFDPDAYEKELEKRGITFLAIDDPAFPAALKEIADPPVFLYARGDLAILQEPCLALVGTREMSEYGERVAESFVPAIVQAGMVTVSGLALGIDAAVARETLAAGGRTVAVLGHGLAMIHPQSNTRLAEEIVRKGSLLLAEFPLDAEPGKFTFPARNRIIAGLSLGTVILEAPEGSGALITAELALEYGREVFAVPGQIFDPSYAGCHQIIARGQARLVSGPSEVLQELKVVVPKGGRSSFSPRSNEEEKAFAALTTMPQAVDDIVGRSGLSTASLTATLTFLELAGAAKQVGNGQWVRA